MRFLVALLAGVAGAACAVAVLAWLSARDLAEPQPLLGGTYTEHDGEQWTWTVPIWSRPVIMPSSGPH